MICPKCGYDQPDALECRKCGVVVAKAIRRASSPVVRAGSATERPPSGGFTPQPAGQQRPPSSPPPNLPPAAARPAPPQTPATAPGMRVPGAPGDGLYDIDLGEQPMVLHSVGYDHDPYGVQKEADEGFGLGVPKPPPHKTERGHTMGLGPPPPDPEPEHNAAALKLTEVRDKAAAALKIGLEGFREALAQRRPPARDRAVFFRQMGRMLQSGLPLAVGFETLRGAMPHGAMRDAVTGLEKDMQAGKHAADAMRERPAVFDKVEASLVDAAERSGRLATIFDRLAARAELTVTLRGKLRASLTYPVTVLALSCLITPAPIAFAKGTGSYITAAVFNVLTLAFFLALLFWSIPLLYNHPRVQPALLRVLERLPFAGTVLISRRYALVFDALSLAVRSGLPAELAIKLGAAASGEPHVTLAGEDAADALRQGQSFTDALRRLPALPGEARVVLASAEKSGTLDDGLESLSRHHATEFQNALHSLSKLLQIGLTVVLVGAAAWGVFSQASRLASDPLSMLPEDQVRELHRELRGVGGTGGIFDAPAFKEGIRPMK